MSHYPAIPYSLTGINCLIQAPKLPGFLLWMYTSPGPLNRQTNPSPEVTLAIQPEVAFSMLYDVVEDQATRWLLSTMYS